MGPKHTELKCWTVHRLIHHTDAERGYAYDADPSSSGRLVTALQEAGPAELDGG
ncbi:hypothetical protein [Mycobacterium sp. OTB74]|uniref:hypothetical protein n=1 Tax=Mycobacterium sp. OTB74 TaxID=1853452 RepID=UPI00247606C4|nr:hypothetical protein [Mycobacterium sp. OTB74]MDH6247978.1 hypothetical protein [Mycobacterium sp. OTB74]